MDGASYYSSEVHGPLLEFELDQLDLEGGSRLRGATLAYTTFGSLSPEKDNAILFPTWYSGTSKILEQVYVGTGRALDPEKYFIIVVNQLGNGLSSSPHNTKPPANAAAFPALAIADDVRAQHRLVTERFGISELQLVLGGSMGAQQTYEWAVRFPEMVKRAAPIAGAARCSAHNALLVRTFKEAITSDPAWENGWYRDSSSVHQGLRRHARVFAASGFTSSLFRNAGWQRLGFGLVDDFMVNFVEAYFLPHDPNNLLCMLNKWEGGDVSRNTGGCLKAALGGIKALVSVIAIEEDVFFPTADIMAEQALVPNSSLKVVSSEWGHLALFGVDPNFNKAIDEHLRDLLASGA